MRVFISWSGERSRQVALILRDLLTQTLRNVSPWMSEEAIPVGTRWSSELTAELESSEFGILCITPSNQNAPWLLFEAGAVSKAVGTARVVPYLIGMSSSDLDLPLGQFQAVSAGKDGTAKLIREINRLQEGSFQKSPEDLDEAIDVWWSHIESRMNDAISREAENSELPKHRTSDEKLDEVLSTVRDLARRSGLPTGVVHPARIRLPASAKKVLEVIDEGRHGVGLPSARDLATHLAMPLPLVQRHLGILVASSFLSPEEARTILSGGERIVE